MEGHALSPFCTHPDHRRSRAALVVLAVTLFFLAGCGRPPEPSEAMAPEVVAVVGDREIRGADLDQELAARGPTASPAEVLGEMIPFEAQLAEARRIGIEAEPETRRAMGRPPVSRQEERQRAGPSPSVTDAEVSALHAAEIDRHTVPAAVRGGVARIAETTNAFHLVRLCATKPRTRRPVQGVADGLRHRILLGKSDERDGEHLRRVLESATLAGLASRHVPNPSNPLSPRPPSP